MELHPDIGPLVALLGTWVGEGAGAYPTIEPFRYQEEVTFGHVGKPFLTYRQSTVNLATGLPAHAEAGYLRAVGNGRVELVLAHPTGVAELEEGTVDLLPSRPGSSSSDVSSSSSAAGATVRLHLLSTSVAGTTTAKEVKSLERTFEVSGYVLRYDLAMGAVGEPHQHHLSAELHRI